MTLPDHDAFISRVLARPGVVLLLGELDSGKTTLARRLLDAAADAGLACACIDADPGQAEVGEPGVAAVLHLPAAPAAPVAPVARAFVGALTVAGHELALLSAIAHLLATVRSRHAGPAPQVVVIDTPALIPGVAGQQLVLHLLRLIAPDHVAGLARGLELEPVLANVRRVSQAEVLQLSVPDAVRPRGPQERAEARRAAFAAVFAGELHRYRIRPTVLVPAVPPGLNPELLSRLLVGLEDGRGGCSGVGLLEVADGGLLLRSPVGQVPVGLRLGALRLAEDFAPQAVDLCQVLQSA